MAFKVIQGTFHLVGYSPDGDSVRFKAQNEANWDLLDGKKVALNDKGHAQLRIEAIDTLETHYNRQHQPLEYAEAAAEKLFVLLGITGVKWGPAHARVTAANDGTTGFIVTRTTEENGRPVCFVFASLPGYQDGQEIYLNKALVRKSVNYRLFKEGLAYPTFYDGLFYDLRELFADQTQKLREKPKGLWAVDKSNSYFQVTNLADVTDNLVILPKLFRRIVAYLDQAGTFDAGLFLEDLKKGNERVLILSKLHFTHFDNVIAVDADGRIKLTVNPEDLVFVS